MRPMLALALLLLCSCQHAVNLRALARGAAVAEPESTKLFAALRDRSAEIRSYRMLFSANLRYEGQKTALRYAFVFSAPEALRIEALPLNGAYTLNALSVYHDRVLFVDQQSRSALRAQSGSGALYRTLRIPADEGDLPWIIAGRVPPAALTDEGAFTLYKNPAEDLLYLIATRGHALYRVSASSFLLQSAQLQDPFSGREALKIELTYGSSESAPPLPQTLELTFPRDEFELSLKSTSRVLNTPIPERVFELQIPGDFEVRDLEIHSAAE